MADLPHLELVIKPKFSDILVQIGYIRLSLWQICHNIFVADLPHIEIGTYSPQLLSVVANLPQYVCDIKF